VENLVYASSSSVYGGNRNLPFDERQAVNHPVSLYAASKKANELMAHTYSHLYGLPATGLRFFTVYGPWGRPDMAPMLFARAILAGEPIKVFNHGKMQRDFTYIDDIVRGTVAALDRVNGFEILNLGNHRSIRLDALIELIGQSCGKDVIIDRQPAPPGDVSKTCASVDKAAKLIGYSPETSIEDGIEKFITWYNTSGNAHQH